MMTILRTRRIQAQGKRDGEHGTNLREQRILAELGARPDFNVEAYPDQALLLVKLKDQERLTELQNPFLHQSPDGPSDELPPLSVMMVGLVLFGLADVAAATRLMYLLGLQNPDRTILGIAMACILIALTSGFRKVIKGTMGVFSGIAVGLSYMLVLVSIGILRLSDLAVSTEVLTVYDFGGAVLLVLSAAGPAWLSDICLQGILESSPDRRHRKHLVRELKTTEREVTQAQRELSKIGLKQREYDQTRARIEAVYETSFVEGAALPRHGNLRRNGG